VLAWVRTLSGSQRLRALIAFDEVYGYLPPHPQNPPTKRPLVALMKQARAFGVGVLVATQNPMDLDYRALSNAGLWCVGRLQTDADRERVLEGLGDTGGHEGGLSKAELAHVVKKLAPRWFLLRDAHAREGMLLLQPRWADRGSTEPTIDNGDTLAAWAARVIRFGRAALGRAACARIPPGSVAGRESGVPCCGPCCGPG
jgi:DNA helicase HerA-like ATPase